MLLFGRIVAATFMFAGVGVLLSLAFSDPKRLLSLGPAIAGLMASAGFLLAKYLGRPERKKASHLIISDRAIGSFGYPKADARDRASAIYGSRARSAQYRSGSE